ncbi:hypothetical protein QYS48_31985 [Marivirga arenosa]|uniref:Uncharacterized protein n=1 Tax=Marivirga arenosa TaxID=3059076 RepID=A0AA51N4N2_9BACT|nr:hypothetical protein [Marivirga sp. ABR2-2]WMN06236.1 hypothetical protein QYS48_31985 [Marivirga sp. ABR2-2]
MIYSQERENHLIFWEKLEAHCGKAYAGEVVTAPVPEDFQKKDLIIHFKSCGEGQIRVPFVVGENRSRTWVFTLSDHNIELKHDHRNKDGSPAEITMYGGTSPNTGFEQMQYFPADQQTVDMIPYAAGNVWWVSISDSVFTYNLRRVSSDDPIRLEFDLTQEVEAPVSPWGWE